jgi:SH3 domain-containing protein
VGDLSVAGPQICGTCAAAHTKPVKADNRRPEAPDLSSGSEPFFAGLEEAPHSSRRQHVATFSRRMFRGLSFALFVFALGSAAGYGFGIYGPRWWPMMTDWSHLVSDFTIDRFAPAAARGGLITPKGLAENKRLDGRTGEDHRATLIAESDRQIAERRWGDARKTYQQIAREFPGDPAATQLGKRLSATLWSEGVSALRAKRPDQALMLFDMLELLPPVPAEAILADDPSERPPRGSPPDDTAGSASLVDPPHAGSSIRPEVTSDHSPKVSDGSREMAAATSAGHLPAPPLPSSAERGVPDEARMRQAFAQFLNGRQGAPSTPSDREKLFVEFRNSLAKGGPGTATPTAAGKESMPRVEIWQARDTTNLRELASAGSPAIGEVAKGSTFRVIGHSDDGKWLKIETHDGLIGYYWAARAREMR